MSTNNFDSCDGDDGMMRWFCIQRKSRIIIVSILIWFTKQNSQTIHQSKKITILYLYSSSFSIYTSGTLLFKKRPIVFSENNVLLKDRICPFLRTMYRRIGTRALNPYGYNFLTPMSILAIFTCCNPYVRCVGASCAFQSFLPLSIDVDTNWSDSYIKSST